MAAEEAHQPPVEILHLILRLMCYQWNAERETRDHNPTTQYHNRHFKTAAEAGGLHVERGGRRGWNRTSLTPELRQHLLEKFRPDPEKFRVFRLLEAPRGGRAFRQWGCACGLSGWFKVAPEPWACSACGEALKPVEKGRKRLRPSGRFALEASSAPPLSARAGG